MKEQQAVLRVPRTDDEDNYVLVHVTSSGSKGQDFKLEATDGQDPFSAELKHNKLSKSKDKKHPIAEDEWERIITEVLMDRQSDLDIEIVAQVAEGQSITLIIRRSISGIKQRIGTITLDLVEEVYDIIDWCSTALLSKRKVEDDLRSVTSKATDLENAVKELKDQLEELIAAKKADESELLEKFRDLLNEKKVKIREQQRLLLPGGDVDPEEMAAVVPSPRRRKTAAAGKGHTPKPSRTSKRKAAEPEPEEDEEPVRVPGQEDEDDDDMEKMEVDKRHGEEDSEEDRTTDAGGGDDDNDNDETASEDEEDGEPVPAATRRGAGGKKKDVDKPPAANTRHASQRKNETPPPPRTLPFNQRKAAAAKPPAPKPEPEGSETESDDEL